MMDRRAFLAGLFSAVASPAFARRRRSSAARRAFVRAHPCPATGRVTGACAGWRVDHIESLCAGGADAPENMQWQTDAEALAKDRLEWAACNAMRR